MRRLHPFCVSAHLIGRNLAECGSQIWSWHDARLHQKHLFTLLMNQLHVTHVPGLQGEGRGGERGTFLLPEGEMPSDTDSHTTCQDRMSL